MPKKKRSINVMLTDTDVEAADLVAEKKDVSRSGLMRLLIRSAAKHVLEHTPTCASCEACRVPQAVHFTGVPHDPPITH